MNSSLFEIVQKGGPLMWLLFLLSVIAVAIITERIIFLRRNGAPIDAFLNGISNLLRQGRYSEALLRCDEGYGPAIRVAQAAILKRHLPKDELREVVREIAQMQMPRLEAKLNFLAAIGHLAPLIGFLGTVVGMIGAFMRIEEVSGIVVVSDLSQNIWEALIVTAGGLTVAIPCYAAYHFLTARVGAIVTDMERCGMEIVHLLLEAPQNPQIEPLLQVSSSEGGVS